MTNRQLAAAETRRKLVKAAKNIICTKGLANTSIEEITAACGVSKGTFYTYFKRKEDIVYELSEVVFDEILENAQEFRGTISQRLENYMINFSGYIERSSLKLAQEWIRNVADPEISDVGAKKLQKDTAALRELFIAGIENGELRSDAPTERFVEAVSDLLYGQLLCWAISNGSYSFEERTREFCRTFLSTLLDPYLL